jgi:hypothetical protein
MELGNVDKAEGLGSQFQTIPLRTENGYLRTDIKSREGAKTGNWKLET